MDHEGTMGTELRNSLERRPIVSVPERIATRDLGGSGVRTLVCFVGQV